jgi:hypothetical protein
MDGREQQPELVKRAPRTRLAGLRRWRYATKPGRTWRLAVAAVGLVGVGGVGVAALDLPALQSVGSAAWSRDAAPAADKVAVTSFGTIAIASAKVSAAPAGGLGGTHGSHAATSTGGTTGAVGAGTSQAADLRAVASPWSSRVTVNLALHNRLDRRVPFSPGQFRLRVGDTGVTVAPMGAGDLGGATGAAGALAGDSTLRTWVSFLAPSDGGRLFLDFADLGRERPVRIALDPAPRASGAQEGHGR